jgi:hypothetical protein
MQYTSSEELLAELLAFTSTDAQAHLPTEDSNPTFHPQMQTNAHTTPIIIVNIPSANQPLYINTSESIWHTLQMPMAVTSSSHSNKRPLELESIGTHKRTKSMDGSPRISFDAELASPNTFLKAEDIAGDLVLEEPKQEQAHKYLVKTGHRRNRPRKNAPKKVYPEDKFIEKFTLK